MMNTKILILSLSLLAQKPMMTPSLMGETYIHPPSVQAFGLDNKETARVSSPVDFIGTVEKMEPDMVPPSSSPFMDILQYIKSLAKQVKTTVSVAAKDFYYEISDARMVFVNDKNETFVNNLVADVLVATAPFRFGTIQRLDEMTSNFAQFMEEFQDVIVSKYQLLNENLETFVRQLPSRPPQRSDIESAARNMIQKITEKYQVVSKEFQSSAIMALSIPSIFDAGSTFFVVCQRAYAKLE